MSDEVMGLKSLDDDQAVALQSVQANGKVQGMTLRMKLRQVYRNTTHDNLECVYTFPLAWSSVLLGMAVELNGKRMTGTVAEKKEAETRYEKAIQTGDLPVMLERSGKDLYTANLGNLQPGDEVVIEVEYAQLLRFEGGMLRLCLPTTIAPRYGDQHEQGGLARHQTTASSGLADYRLYLNLDISSPLDQGTITSSSHTVQQVKHQNGVTVKLQSNAWLDRDFVLNILGLKDMTFATVSADVTQPGQYTLLSSAVAYWEAPHHRPASLRMKVLVDGSGSMQGDSNAQAKDALDWLFHQLQVDDEVSLTRFGSETLHVLPRLQVCSPAYQRRLRSEARNIKANLGGTKMDEALRSVMAITHEDEKAVQSASILLITDGEVWDIENIVATVRKSGHRLFALGVGSAPAESLLRELAEVSGGACEMVSPNQSMQQAVGRLLDRMRKSCAVETRLIDVDEMLYQSPGPKEMTQGDTIHQWAQVHARPSTAPIMQWTMNGQTHARQADNLIWDEEGVLPRLCAAQRMLDITDEERQRSMALLYQLVTKHTNFILVHERAEGEKGEDLPKLQQIAQMQAAGAGGYGTVIQDSSLSHAQPMLRMSRHNESLSLKQSLNTPTVWRTSRAESSISACESSAGMDDIEIPAFLRKQSEEFQMPVVAINARQITSSVVQGITQLVAKGAEALTHRPQSNSQQAHELASVLKTLDAPNNPLIEILHTFNKHALGNRTLRSALSVTLATAQVSFMTAFVLRHAKPLGSPAMVWAVILFWLAETKGMALDRHALRLIEAEIAKLDGEAVQELLQQLASPSISNQEN
jgi:Ca-activated chloride channel family protein